MYGPVNVPGAAGVDLEEITNAVKTAQSAAAEAKRLVEELQKSMEPARYVGRSKEQVEAFLCDIIRPLLEENRELLGVKAEINV